MRNSIPKIIYHSFLKWRFGIKHFRGGWMLTQTFVNDWKRHWKEHPIKVAKIHCKGWSYSDWAILGITDNVKGKYLSTVQYCSLHPFTGSESSWIDDKLTLKYILHGTPLSGYMPKYYYQIECDGKILKLMDAPEEYLNTITDVIKLLIDKGALALKKIKGSLGEGFYSIIKEGSQYIVNGNRLSEKELNEFLSAISGYLVMELLMPNSYFAKYNKTSVGCLRYVIGRKLDGSIIDIYSFMRIGTKKSGSVENFNRGGVLVILDEDGKFETGYVLDEDTWTSRNIARHPDNGLPLKGFIPKWCEIKTVSKMIAEILPQLNYLGIDFVVTRDNNLKILEINSLTSLDSIQLDKSIFDTKGGDFFKERLRK